MIEDAGVLCDALQPLPEHGDRLLLMSDGIAEATDANGKLFGFERIHDLLRESGSAAAIRQRSPGLWSGRRHQRHRHYSNRSLDRFRFRGDGVADRVSEPQSTAPGILFPQRYVAP